MPQGYRDVLEDIRARADIVEIIGSVISLKKKGKDFWAPCPFHNEKDPSFSVVPAKRIFHCFGCGAQGDVFEFWIKYHGVGFSEAVRAVGGLCGTPVPLQSLSGHRRTYMEHPKKPDAQVWKPSRHGKPERQWREKAMKFAQWALDQIFENKDALDYLVSRGLHEDTIIDHRLGWNPGGEREQDLYRARESWGLHPVLNDKGVKQPLWLPRGWVTPFFDARGEIIKIRIRRADPLKFNKKMRYYFVPGGEPFTTMVYPDRPVHIVVESDLDAYLVSQEIGDLVGVVCLGSTSSRPDERATEILKRSSHIMNAMDFDRAGAQAQA